MRVVAHRGYSGKYPENTMLAFQKALEAGCDEIELDVQLTRDGVVVIIHDERIERTTDGHGLVKDYTYEELCKFNAAVHFGHISDFEPIPTFEEYCRWVKDTGLSTNIEIKTGLYYYEEIEAKTIELVRKYGLEDRVLYSSFNHMSMVRVKQIDPNARCGALVSEKGLGNAGYYCEQMGFYSYHPGYAGLTAEEVEGCRKHQIQVNVWTVNTMEALENMRDWGCDGIITNYPEVARAWLDHCRDSR